MTERGTSNNVGQGLKRGSGWGEEEGRVWPARVGIRPIKEQDKPVGVVPGQALPLSRVLELSRPGTSVVALLPLHAGHRVCVGLSRGWGY